MIKNKRGQVAEGLTWVVATIAIIIILTVSIFVVSRVLDLDDNEVSSETLSVNVDQKSFLSYLLTEESSGGSIIFKIKSDGDLNDFNGNLASRVFRGLYGEEKDVWLGVSEASENSVPSTLISLDYAGKENLYFGEKPLQTAIVPSSVYTGFFQIIGLGTTGSSIYLDKTKDKIVEVIFSEK